jgi:hypothetical protein
MKTPAELAIALEAARTTRRLKRQDIVARTGLNHLSVRGLLDGNKDSRISTLLAVAHEVGLEVMLIPKDLSQHMQADNTLRPAGSILSVVDVALGKKSG